jgi:hypothetical protein
MPRRKLMPHESDAAALRLTVGPHLWTDARKGRHETALLVRGGATPAKPALQRLSARGCCAAYQVLWSTKTSISRCEARCSYCDQPG